MGLCDRDKREVCVKEEECVSAVKKGKRGGVRVHWKTIEKKVHQTLKVILNGICVFCKKEEW